MAKFSVNAQRFDPYKNFKFRVKSPGQTKYEPIMLERGVTHDKDFEQWANKVWNYGSGLGAEVSLRDFRKDIIIELMNRLLAEVGNRERGTGNSE